MSIHNLCGTKLVDELPSRFTSSFAPRGLRGPKPSIDTGVIPPLARSRTGEETEGHLASGLSGSPAEGPSASFVAERQVRGNDEFTLSPEYARVIPAANAWAQTKGFPDWETLEAYVADGRVLGLDPSVIKLATDLYYSEEGQEVYSTIDDAYVNFTGRLLLRHRDLHKWRGGDEHEGKHVYTLPIHGPCVIGRELLQLFAWFSSFSLGDAIRSIRESQVYDQLNETEATGLILRTVVAYVENSVEDLNENAAERGEYVADLLRDCGEIDLSDLCRSKYEFAWQLAQDAYEHDKSSWGLEFTATSARDTHGDYIFAATRTVQNANPSPHRPLVLQERVREALRIRQARANAEQNVQSEVN